MGTITKKGEAGYKPIGNALMQTMESLLNPAPVDSYGSGGAGAGGYYPFLPNPSAGLTGNDMFFQPVPVTQQPSAMVGPPANPEVTPAVPIDQYMQGNVPEMPMEHTVALPDKTAVAQAPIDRTTQEPQMMGPYGAQQQPQTFATQPPVIPPGISGQQPQMSPSTTQQGVPEFMPMHPSANVVSGANRVGANVGIPSQGGIRGVPQGTPQGLAGMINPAQQENLLPQQQQSGEGILGVGQNKLGYALGMAAQAVDPEGVGGRLGAVGAQMNTAKEYEDQLARAMQGQAVEGTFLSPQQQAQIGQDVRSSQAADLQKRQVEQELVINPAKAVSYVDYLNAQTDTMRDGKYALVPGTNIAYNSTTGDSMPVSDIPGMMERQQMDIQQHGAKAKISAQYDPQKQFNFMEMRDGIPYQTSQARSSTGGVEELGSVPITATQGSGSGSGSNVTYKKLSEDERKLKMKQIKDELNEHPDKDIFAPRKGPLGIAGRGSAEDYIKNDEFKNAPADAQALAREYTFLKEQRDIEGYLDDYSEFDPYARDAYNAIKQFNLTAPQPIPLIGMQGLRNLQTMITQMQGR